MDFRSFVLKGRLPFPVSFEKHLRKLMLHLPEDASESYPAARMLADEASFLYARLLSLQKEIRGVPALPVEGKEVRLMLVCRDICLSLPLHPGQMMQKLRVFYDEREMRCREGDALPVALACAIMEQLDECLSLALTEKEEEKQLALQKHCAQLLQALHQLPKLPFNTILEHLNPVCQILRQDETYRQMDRESRLYYRSCVCRIARKGCLHETAVARAALALTEGKEGIEKEAGYYLTEKQSLIYAYLLKESHSFSSKQKTLFYLLPFFLSALVLSVLFIFSGFPLLLLPFFLLAASEIVRILYYRILRRLFPARMLPRLHKKHLADKRLLVVVPTLLCSKKQAYQMARQLHVLHAATPHAHFMLLSDFPDSQEPLSSADQEILAAAQASIQALNNETDGVYFYFQRSRSWDEGQQAFCGRERKRGALEDLNLLLCGRESPDAFLYASCPLSSLAHSYDHVITLDADTFLPPGAAAKLQGAMEHPLQKGRIAVIQPRMENLAENFHTRTQYFLSAQGGVDAYHTFVQSVYQDVFGCGSFAGKGIFDPSLFLQRTESRFPSGRILSHDLIEGEFAHAATAEDIALYDTQPAHLSGWQKRLHRWTRGDWQLLPFLKDKALPLLSRWKIYDNLRTSLVPLCQMLLLIFGTVFHQPLLFLFGLPWPLHGMIKRTLLFPGKAYTQLDAIIRSLYRQFISRKHLLSWVTADQAETIGGLSLLCILCPLAAGTATILFSLLPGGFLPGLVPGILWLVSPLFVRFMDAKKPLHPALSEGDKASVLSLCRDTWHFFEKNVHAGTFFLPPDNVQLQPDKGPALRTSPTNIGLYLLSVLAAKEMGFLTAPQMARRMLRTVETLERLEKWQGHLYNWYSLETLSPLPPRFVSTVDSGNLCACLLACAQGVRQCLESLDEKGRTLPLRLDHLAEKMRFDRLYDPSCHLFHIGYDTHEKRLSQSHYDLLASECRLTSFVAVMQRQVPLKHWFSLGRMTVRQGGGAALLSWGGTAFEYLMPHLLLPLHRNTLLFDGCLNAIRAQITAAGHRPFGISESGYFAFDTDLQYQYRAFGLPSLAVSEHTKGNVVAPYASMLALPFLPDAAIRNLQWMRRLSWYSDEGLFEAADYTPTPMDAPPHLVKSHMAHHQGMILCAGCNLLTDFSLVRHFMTPAKAKAYSFLLCERKPLLPSFSRPLPRKKEPAASFPSFAFPCPMGYPLAAHALCGKSVTWVMNAKGDGFLKSESRLWTRFHPSFPSGPRFYLRNVQSGAFICPQTRENLIFENGCIRIPFHAFQLQGEMRLLVLPLSDEAVCDIRLENKGTLDAEIEVISYLEVTQSTYREDKAHPNFRDLSVLIEEEGDSGLLCRRLSQKEDIPLLVHRITGDYAALHRQGDRLLFLGRDGHLDAPSQLCQSAGKCVYRTGAVIAPCLSLRGLVRLRPGQKAHVQFVTGEKALQADIPPLETPIDEATLSLCRTKAAMSLRFLGLSPQSVPLYNRVLGSLCFSCQPHQAVSIPSSIHTLWQYGISGDEPLLTVFLQSPDKKLIRHALCAHALMETSGIKTVLLFLCDKEREEYFTPLQNAVHAAIDAVPAGKERIFICTGGIENAKALRSLSALYLESGTPLSRQLNAIESPFPAAHPLPDTAPPAALPPLFHQNSCGGFTADGDYCIFAPPPAPWHNLLMGQRFGTLLCENAVLHSFSDNSQMNRVTKHPLDVHRPDGSEYYFLTDAEGHSLSLTGGTVFHRIGVTEYHSMPFSIKCKMILFSHASEPFGLRLIQLQSEKEAHFTLRCLIRFERDGKTGVFTEDGFAYAASSRQEGLSFAHLPQGECFAPPFSEADFPLFAFQGGSNALFQCSVHLKPHQAETFPLIIGFAQNRQEAHALAGRFLHQGMQDALQETKRFWQEKLDKLLLFGGESWLRLYLNRWLPYQALCARLYGRTGPYQAGGAFGFRDQLQDVLCCLLTNPGFARNHLLLCAAHQYREGDVQHWWHAPRTGVRTRISDDKLFLPFLTALYAETTGDLEVLEEQIPFLVSAPLAPEEDDRYETPLISPETASLMVHCLLAMESVAFGPHGIPLMGSGDWNDGMNTVGGESVWLGFFLCMVYQHFAPLCDAETAKMLREKRSELLKNMEKAWTGAWYLRAWYKTGEALGGPATNPPRTDLISQCFACLAGAPRDHVRTALQHALQQLWLKDKGMVLLLSPPFTPREKAGYIGSYLPGVRENGGQYTHAVPWLIMALCRIGEYDAAWQIARDILPLFHTDTPEKLQRYRTEPYVLCGDVYAGENLGRGGWSFYTGSAAWLYYVYVTVLLGFEKKGNRLRLNPCPNETMEEFSFIWRHGSTTYHLTASKNTLFATLDGERLKDGWLTLTEDGRTHEAHFPYRKN